ncbi:hypothetical protein DFAR_3690016 [Desulfarculales bacterium]
MHNLPLQYDIGATPIPFMTTKRFMATMALGAPAAPRVPNWLQAKLDALQAISFDVTAACSGFVFALDTAIHYLWAGVGKTTLVVASQIMTRVQGWTDRASCILWDDGAGAVVLKAEEGLPQVLENYVDTDGANG